LNINIYSTAIMATSLPFEEKKDDVASRVDENIPAVVDGPLLSPSKRRVRAANSAGLSELSKQLRIFQAKNEAQAVEINRLERQLRILAELQGISVADLRKALEDACANEAFGEMQHRVAKLRAELEAASLAKRTELRKDATAPHIANLELRVGELEEVEEKQQAEIHHLYEQLRHERARATRLESEAEQNKKDAQDYLGRFKQESSRAARLETTFQENLIKLEEEQALKLKQQAQEAQANRDAGAASASASVPSISPEMAEEYERMVQILKKKDEALRRAHEMLNAEKDKASEKMKEVDDQARQAQMGMKVDQDQMALIIKELQDADSQNELRLAQYKARFSMQDERIEDMEQQLNSLYMAFTLLKEEFNAESSKFTALKNNLDEADAVVARQVDDEEKNKNGGRGVTPRKSSDSPQGIPREITTPSTVATQMSPSATPRSAARSPGSPNSYASTPHASTPYASTPYVSTPYAVGTPVADAYISSRTMPPASPTRTPTTWQLLRNRDTDSPPRRSFSTPNRSGALVSGNLIVKSKSAFRKWKTKSSSLYLSGDHYQWAMEGKSFALEFGISRVEFYPNHPLSFVVHPNPFDSMAPVIYAAAMNEADYHRWMAALTKATSGEEYEPRKTPERRLDAVPTSEASAYGSIEAAQGSQRPATMSFRLSSAGSMRTSLSAEEQEAADLEHALQLSKQMEMSKEVM